MYRAPDQSARPILLVMKEKEHDRFVRAGDDLVYTHRVSLTEALTGFTATVPTLDGKDVSVNFKSRVVSPGMTHSITGAGMPVLGKEGKFGDLIIRFEIEFPKALSQEQVQLVQELAL